MRAIRRPKKTPQPPVWNTMFNYSKGASASVIFIIKPSSTLHQIITNKTPSTRPPHFLLCQPSLNLPSPLHIVNAGSERALKPPAESTRSLSLRVAITVHSLVTILRVSARNPSGFDWCTIAIVAHTPMHTPIHTHARAHTYRCRRTTTSRRGILARYPTQAAHHC